MNINIHPEDLENVILETLMNYNIINHNNPEGNDLKLYDIIANGNVDRGKMEVKLLAVKIFSKIINSSIEK